MTTWTLSDGIWVGDESPVPKWTYANWSEPEVREVVDAAEAAHSAALEVTRLCQECGEMAERGGEWMTCMGWAPHRDDRGRVHMHDPNRRDTTWLCAKGHKWSLPTPFACPACGWTRGGSA